MCVVMQWQPHLVTGGQHGALMVLPGVCLLLCKVLMYIFYGIFCSQTCSAMDALAQTLMKGAVNCDKHSDLQNSVNQLVVECGIRFWAFPESMSSSLFANCAWACVCASCALIYIYIDINAQCSMKLSHSASFATCALLVRWSLLCLSLMYA